MSNRYELRLYDKTLLTIELTPGQLGGYSIKIVSVNGPSSFLPLDLEITDHGIRRWLGHRILPRKRAFAQKILSALDLTMNDIESIINASKLLSLTDSYWVVPEGFADKFSAHNFYENPFSESLSCVALTGVSPGKMEPLASPELTTNGTLPKAWSFVENDGIYLHKGGSKEPYSEYYATQIAVAMGLDVVRYDLGLRHGILTSRCRLFTDIDTSFVSIGRIIKSSSLKAVIAHYDSLGGAFADAIRDMLIFDALIINEDRHFGNFGLLRDNHTGKITAPAPLFDHGITLFNYAKPGDFDRLEEYVKTRAPAYPGTTFEGICRQLITARQVEKLRKLADFTFTRHPQFNLPEEHLAAMENYLRRRASELIDLAQI